MSPRGVPIVDVRGQLLRAAEVVLLREGPQGVSGRAITREAGCATGLLYSHFPDLDGLLAELVVDRFRTSAALTAQLPSRAGTGTVEDNLVGVAVSLIDSSALVLANLVLVRSGLRVRIEDAMAAGSPGLPEIIASTADYVAAEERLGRLPAGTDAEAVAVAVVGTAHHLLITHGGGHAGDPHELLRRLVRVIVRPLSDA